MVVIPEAGEYLSVDEAAVRAGVTTSHMSQMIRSGNIKAIQISSRCRIISAEEINQYLQRPPSKVGRPRNKPACSFDWL